MVSLKKTAASVILTASLLIIDFHAGAQTIPVKKLLFETITINDGLSQGMVNCIIQDHYGFMWFATKDGLNRYDGYHFVVYRHGPSNPNSIADNYVETIFEDSKGRLWVGTTSQGLELFERETETFRHFKKEGDGGAELGRVNCITENKEGQIWITSFAGTMVLTESEDAKTKASLFTFRKIIDHGRQIFITKNGTVWISAWGQKLFRVSKTNTGKEAIDSIPSAKYETAGRGVNWFWEDTGHRCLFLFSDYCIASFDEKQNTFNTICPGTTTIFSVSANDKTFWMVDMFRIRQFDRARAEVNLIESMNASLEIMATNANCVYTDKSGIVWIGTAGYGILKYNPRAEKFNHTDAKSVFWMGSTSEGKIMLTEDQYLQIFDKNTVKYIGTIPDTTIPGSRIYENAGHIEGAVQDGDGLYWICKNALFTYNATTKTFKTYPYGFTFPLYKDDLGGVWFGSTNEFCNYNIKTKEIVSYKYPIATAHYPYKFAQAVYEDNTGIFWLGTISGLLRFDPVRASWKIFKNDPADSMTLSFDLIFCLCPDPLEPDKYLWVGTNGGGLNRFDMRNGKVRRYSVKDGLPNDVVYGILSDTKGCLWMSTNNGLSKLDRNRINFRNFNINDGLQSNEFNRYAFCKTSDGTLFFGGINGFNYFNPAEIENNASVPNVMITDFRISNQAVAFNEKNAPLSKPVYLADKIILPYRDNMISFDFAALDFTNTQKNTYKYKLEGFDHDWINLGTLHTATYTNLDPGTYTFSVQGSNSDGLWNEKGTSLQLVILPPWYMTWWFRVAAATAVIAMLYAFYRYRLQQALKVQAIRNRIAQDLHDEIGSNLSNISIFTEVAEEKFSEPQSVQSLLRKIKDSTQTSQEAMSDIVWMINTRNDRFENIMIRMRALAAELFETTNQQLNMDFDERLNDVKLGMEERKNFYLIYKEALNNIVKYAGCKNVWIEMKMHDGGINLKIRDDGQGFDAKKNYSGNGLLNMKRRAEQLKGKLCIQSESGNGTSIELNFPV
jgi:signal transduction histidine kinase/ligand-binding sensor domain-containing protein